MEGDLRYLRVGGVEVLRRIFVSVRDSSWGTIGATTSELLVEQRKEGFIVSFKAEHRRGEMAFLWHGSILAESKGDDVKVQYEMLGRALSNFQTNRTGICLLHPVKECAGQECLITHTDGTCEESQFPRLIAPHQPFRDVRGLAYGPVMIDFEGEVFETEDQRNWSDGSFKTYSRPLSKPFPYELRAGQEVRQAVVLRLIGPQRQEREQRIDLGEVTGPLPEIGLRQTPAMEAKLAPLNLSFLAKFEDSGDLQIQRWGNARVIVCPKRKPFATPQEIETVRHSLPDHSHVGGGTIGNFTELNRNRPAGMKLLAYPINPQVHAMDDLSLIENLQGQADTVHTARSFAPEAHIAVGPIILHRRPDPFAAGKGGKEMEAVHPDPRQRTAFGAAWTLVSIKRLAEAGGNSLLYYETFGPFGVMDEAGPFPVYDVFGLVGEMKHAQVIQCVSSDELAFDALALKQGSRLRVLVASMTDQPVDVIIGNLPNGEKRLTLRPYEIITLDYHGKELIS